MENLIPGTPLPVIQCQACYSTVQEDDDFCPNCGFPLKAPAEEREAFINNRNLKAFELTEMQKQIKKASNSIFLIGGFTAVLGIILYFVNSDADNSVALLLVNLVLAVIFTGLGFWCQKQPVAAIICALSLYIILWVITIIENPVNIAKGIIIKIVIISYLIKGLTSAFEAQKIKKAHNL